MLSKLPKKIVSFLCPEFNIIVEAWQTFISDKNRKRKQSAELFKTYVGFGDTEGSNDACILFTS